MNYDFKEESFPIVWVESGRGIPKYLKKLISLTRELHPSINQVLINDGNCKLRNLTSIEIGNLPKSKFTKDFLSLSLKFPHKDVVFWRNTTLRFFYLYDFMLHYDIEKILHLESDVILLDLRDIEKLSLQDGDFVAYPSYSPTLGTAAVFFVNSRRALERFLRYILKESHGLWKNDMELLGQYQRHEGSLALPSHLRGDFSIVYDAGSIGVFFFGGDARGYRIPFSFRGTLPLSEDFELSEVFLSIDVWHYKVNDQFLELCYESFGNRYIVQNIHVHSKNIPKSKRILIKRIKRAFMGKKDFFWQLGRLDFTVLAERTISFLARRVLKRRIIEPRFR